MIVADWIVKRLMEEGVVHVFGVGGANIEDIFAALQRHRPRICAVLAKHEHAAGTAADAYARIRGSIGVVLATSGGGTMNLVHALAEAYASSVPLVAILGEPPTLAQGLGAFQDTSGKGDAIDGASVLARVSGWCKRAHDASEVPALLNAAIANALELSKPAVLLLAKDYQTAELSTAARTTHQLYRPSIATDAHRVLLQRPVMIIAGPEVARSGAVEQLQRVAEALDAKVAVTPDGRDAFDNFSPRFIGVAGALGHSTVKDHLRSATTVLLVGSRMPLMARQGLEQELLEKPTISLGLGAPYIQSRVAYEHIYGPLQATLACLIGVDSATMTSSLPSSTVHLCEGHPAKRRNLTGRAAIKLLGKNLPPNSVVIVDAGNTGALATHWLPVPRGGRWLLALGMAGMGYAFGAAVGAAFASGERCTVVAGDGAFLMNGLDIHTAVEHQLPITYVIFNNRAHGMCLVRERLLLHDSGGYNTFGLSHFGAGLAAMFPGLHGVDVNQAEDFRLAIEQAQARSGPSVVAVELDEVEVPPHAAFWPALRAGVETVSREKR